MDFNRNSVPSLPVVQYDHEEAWQIMIFWTRQIFIIENAEEFKKQLQLPLARVKRIMKSEGQAEMVSAEAPKLMSKACEFFIQKLAIFCWICALRSHRHIIERSDIATTIVGHLELDFLAEVLPPALIQPHLQAAQEARNAGLGGNQGDALSFGSTLMGHAMMNNAGNQERSFMTSAAENQVALPFDPSFMGYPMMNVGTGANVAGGGNLTPMLYDANFMGNPMLDTGNQGFGDAMNNFAGNQAPIPYVGGFMEIPTTITGSEENFANLAAGSQPALSYTGADFMGNPMFNNEEAGNDLNIMGGNQVSVPNNAAFMGTPMMNMGYDNVGSSHQLPQSSNMMEPTIMPSDNLPHNYHLK